MSLVIVVVQVVLECPLVDDNSGFPYSVVVVAPSTLVYLEAFVGKLLVVLLVPLRSSILSVLRSVLLLKMELRLSSKFATSLLVVLPEAVEASFVLVPVPRDPDDVMDLVLVSLVVAHMLAVAVQA